MAGRLDSTGQRGMVRDDGRGIKSSGTLDADIIIANAPDPVFVSDLEGKILQANDAVSQLLGFRQDEVLEQSLSRFISPEETREFTAALREVVERGVMRNVVLNPRSASGEVIPTSLNASALRDPDGRAIGVIGILRDMRELDKARAYAESLIKNAPDPVFVSDLEGKILQANDAVFALLGFRPDELIEQSLSRIISPEETREFLAALREVVERGVTRNARLNPRSASGEVIPTTLNASALRDADGRVIGGIGILRDMRELDKARAYAESLIKNAPDPVFVSDLEGKILQANDAVSALLGFRPDELLEQSLSRFISAEETREFTAALREVVERGVTRNARLNPRSASGEIIPTTLNASALRDPDGKVIGAIGILRDMRELDKARAYAESLIKNAPDPVFVSDLEGKILQANDAVFALLGFRPDELIEQSLSRIISARGDARVPGRPAGGRGAGRHPQRPAQPAQRERGGHPDDSQRLGPARPRREGHRRHRHPARHARVRAGGSRPGEVQERAAGEDPGSREIRGSGRRPRVEDDRAREGAGEPAEGDRTAEAGQRSDRDAGDACGPIARRQVIERRTDARAELQLRAQVETLERRLRKRDEQRRAMLHIMGDLNESNKRLANQRKAMLHILADYEQDRRRLARQTERLDNSRRALLHILQDSHKDKLRLEASRKAMIHIMGDLRETTSRDAAARAGAARQTGAARPGGKARDARRADHRRRPRAQQPSQQHRPVRRQRDRPDRARGDGQTADRRRAAPRHAAGAQGHRDHLASADVRTGGAPASRERTSLKQVIERALSLMQEQLRLREIEVTVDLGPDEPVVSGNPIQLEQVFINLLTNARDAMADSAAQGDPHFGCRRRRGGGARVRRYRARNSARARAADLRSVLHHQGGRERHGAWPVDHLRHHQGARRHDLGRERARRRRDVPHPACRWPGDRSRQETAAP